MNVILVKMRNEIVTLFARGQNESDDRRSGNGKGGLACVEFYGIPEPGGGELAWLLDPDLYSDDLEGD